MERADIPLKDNRLAPLGFTTSHPAYDTTMMAGLVLNDDDFNLDELGEEGSGTDEIAYHIPLNGYTGLVYAHARLHYQSVPPKWLEEMFAYNTEPIDRFKDMYEATGADPVLVVEDDVETLIPGLDEALLSTVQLYPNPSADGRVSISSDSNIESITAVVIGGISLFGGRGSVLGPLFGALIVGVFSLGLRLLGVDVQWTYLLIGVLIITAVSVDQWIRKATV